MLSVREEDIVQAQVVPCENGRFGVKYVTSDGRQGMDEVGSKENADAVISRVAMRLNTSSNELGLFPRDIAAS